MLRRDLRRPRRRPGGRAHHHFEAGTTRWCWCATSRCARTCEHHLVPFIGHGPRRLHPGRDGRITGLSKLARLVDVYAKRPAGAGTADDPGRRRDRASASSRAASSSSSRPSTCACRCAACASRAPRPSRRRCAACSATAPSTRSEAMSLILQPMTAERPWSAGSRPAVACMGVVNVTPDSFSDGGAFDDADARSSTAWRCSPPAPTCSTSAASRPVPARSAVERREELRRVLPVVRALAAAGRGRQHRHDARRGRRGRARRPAPRIINDVSGGLADAGIRASSRPPAAATSSCTGAGTAPTMQQRAVYDDVVAEVRDELAARVDAVVAGRRRRRAGRARPRHRVREDAEHNWALLAASATRCCHSASRCSLARRRKSFLGTLLADADGAAPGASATTPRPRCPRLPRGPAPGGCGCTTRAPARTPYELRQRWSRPAAGGAAMTTTRGRRRGHGRQPGALRRLRGGRPRPDGGRWDDADDVRCIHPAGRRLRTGSRHAVVVGADGQHQLHPVLPHRSHRRGRRRLRRRHVRGEHPHRHRRSRGRLGGSQKVLATNVFRRRAQGWRLWVHHASPVLAPSEANS